MDGLLPSYILFVIITYKDFYTKVLTYIYYITPSQAGAYISYMPSLLQMNCTWDLLSGLVNKSVYVAQTRQHWNGHNTWTR